MGERYNDAICQHFKKQHMYNAALEHYDTLEHQRNGIFREEPFHNAFRNRMMAYNAQYR